MPEAHLCDYQTHGVTAEGDGVLVFQLPNGKQLPLAAARRSGWKLSDNLDEV